MASTAGKWESRWIWAAIVQGGMAAILIFYLVVSQVGFLKPEVSRVIAGGGAGTWFTLGLLTYIVVAVMGSALTATFYHYIETSRGVRLNCLTSLLAWVHVLAGNIGAIAATWMMMYGGYLGGAALLPSAVGGWGWSVGKVHENILGPLTQPIAAAILVLWLGFVAGGLAYLLALGASRA